MKIFVMSDIHGSIYYLEKALECFEKEEADYILILGDILYHGPRNPLPKDYNPKLVAEKLNLYKDKIIALRGNCDSEVDQMLLDFPIMSDFTNLFLGDKRIFASHGHLFTENKLPISKGDILISGHTHLPLAKKKDIYIFNPGSITLPKEENPHSYGILTSSSWKIKDLDGQTFKSIIY
ncbi:MAG: phosphodiesterase [Psychrilyobacter sp.]|uniref:phosphodiesterase n=1 Tax=Psychrilyobacter sp. TaxID=2586924 RepID=UPI003C77BCBC